MFHLNIFGSNDLKQTFCLSAKEIAAGAETLVEVIQDFTQEKQGFVPQIILVSPPEIGPGIADSVFNCSFSADAVEKSKELAGYYRQAAERRGCIFFNAAQYIRPSDADSLHLMPEAHAVLAERLSEVVTLLPHSQCNQY